MYPEQERRPLRHCAGAGPALRLNALCRCAGLCPVQLTEAGRNGKSTEVERDARLPSIKAHTGFEPVPPP
jgi:hypothetical protein